MAMAHTDIQTGNGNGAGASPWYSIKEYSKILGKSASTVTQMVKQGKLDGKKVGSPNAPKVPMWLVRPLSEQSKQQQVQEAKHWVKVSQAARALKIHASHLYRLITAKKIETRTDSRGIQLVRLPIDPALLNYTPRKLERPKTRELKKNFRWMSPQAAAKVLKCDKSTIYTKLRAKELKGRQEGPGGRWSVQVPIKDIEALKGVRAKKRKTSAVSQVFEKAKKYGVESTGKLTNMGAGVVVEELKIKEPPTVNLTRNPNEIYLKRMVEAQKRFSNELLEILEDIAKE